MFIITHLMHEVVIVCRIEREEQVEMEAMIGDIQLMAIVEGSMGFNLKTQEF